MESAIPPHLGCPRTRPRAVADDFTPPVASWSARAPESMTEVAIGYFGVQGRKGADARILRAGFETLLAELGAKDGPARRDLARYVDADGYENLIAIAYWDDPFAYGRWRTGSFADWWSADERLREPIGYFREVLTPRMERLETIFSSTASLQGLGALMGGFSDEIREHGYWGSMRDRLPAAQIEALNGEGALAAITAGRGRLTVAGHRNLVVIRSGQDWSKTDGAERRLYLDDIEPTLRAGMDYLRDHGREAGCYVNRYVRLIDEAGDPIEKSFGYSHWRSLAHLERWAASHPTHLAIFDLFLRVAAGLEKLELHHEVCVLEPEWQTYEYVNCYAGTGLAGAL